MRIMLILCVFICSMFACQSHFDLSDQTVRACTQHIQEKNDLILLTSSSSKTQPNQIMMHFKLDKQLNVSEARLMIVQATSQILHELKNMENFSLKDLEIWISFLDKNGKHPSKEYIGFLTLSQGNFCYRHYDKGRFPFEEFCNYHNETLEDAIQLSKELFSGSSVDHWMVSELEIAAKQEQLQPIICRPVYESG